METKDDFIKATIRELLRVAKLYSRIEELPIKVEENFDVTTREAHTIQAIGEHEKISVTDVAQLFGITKSAASQMVSRLAQKGCLTKNLSLHSNKEYDLSLTPMGWKVFHAHEQFHGKDMAELVERLNGFSLSQIATLSVMLEAIGNVMRQRLSQGEK
ncbi:MarR family transcriptional regulator [Desulfocarbo indianensis]|nr:MarR family transcriptional regulator [Desulfocarbo indianensis]